MIAFLQIIASLDESCSFPLSTATRSREADYSFHDQDLPAIPLDIHPDRVAIKERMMKRGANFQMLVNSSQLKAYTHQQGEAAYSLRKTPKAFSHTVGDLQA